MHPDSRSVMTVSSFFVVVAAAAAAVLGQNVDTHDAMDKCRKMVRLL